MQDTHLLSILHPASRIVVAISSINAYKFYGKQLDGDFFVENTTHMEPLYGYHFMSVACVFLCIVPARSSASRAFESLFTGL